MSMVARQRSNDRGATVQPAETDRFAVLAMNVLAGLILLIAVVAAAPVTSVGGYFVPRFVTPSHSPEPGSAARAAARAAMVAATLSPARARSAKISAAAWKRPAR